MTLKFFTCVLLCFMALQLCVLGRRTKRNTAQTECEFGDWEAWSNCSATCGAPMRTRVRTCYCNNEVAEAVNCQGEATAQSYCPSSCVRNAAYWRNYNSETTRSEFDKPWPLPNSENNIFYCDLGADAAKMALTWFEIINKPNPAPSDPWLSLATQYIAAVQNVQAGVNITGTSMERAFIDAGQLLRVCNGYSPTDLNRVSVVYQFIGKFNTGTASSNGTSLCEDTPCCYVSIQNKCKCPGYAVDEALLPMMCNMTETSTQPESADIPVDETADEVPEVPATADETDVVPEAPAPAVPSKTVPSTVPVVNTPCIYLAWTESPCNASCGGGVIVRTRPCSCDGFTPETSCTGEQPTEMRPCNTQECPTTQDCHWLEWGQYTPCSVECGGGTMVRRKACSCPEPAEENGACEGEAPVENAACNINPCPESVESAQPQEANHTNTVTDNGQGAAKPVEFGQGSFHGDGNAPIDDSSLPHASSSFSQSIANLLSTSYFLIPVGIILTVAVTITVTVLAMRRIYSGRIFEIPDIPDDLGDDDDEEIELDSATLKKLQGSQYKV